MKPSFAAALALGASMAAGRPHFQPLVNLKLKAKPETPKEWYQRECGLPYTDDTALYSAPYTCEDCHVEG